MLFPAGPFSKMLVRDAHARQDLGVYALQVEVEVACRGDSAWAGVSVFHSRRRYNRSTHGF
jgi:hypothetical protein